MPILKTRHEGLAPPQLGRLATRSVREIVVSIERREIHNIYEGDILESL